MVPCTDDCTCNHLKILKKQLKILKKLNGIKGVSTLIFLLANLCTANAVSYYDLTYMPHAIYHFKAYNIIYSNIVTDELLNV